MESPLLGADDALLGDEEDAFLIAEEALLGDSDSSPLDTSLRPVFNDGLFAEGFLPSDVFLVLEADLPLFSVLAI